jgi:hypothetical protein
MRPCLVDNLVRRMMPDGLGCGRCVPYDSSVCIPTQERGNELKPDSAELLRRLRQYRGRLPADFKFNRLAAYEDDCRGCRCKQQPKFLGRF